ncbi:MAG TPA: M15 family metallopeptidase [Kineosporiaceae bacterium]|nr:M15 family metallopeptidase [Kineosporiaceae bacterium]
MIYGESAARTATRPTRSIVLAAVVVISAVIGVAASSLDILPGHLGLDGIGVDSDRPATSGRPATSDRPGTSDRRDSVAPLGEADGAVPDGVTVFDGDIPGVANLDPDLLGALRHAATDAADDGVEFFVNSGWRSPAYQEQLLHEAVSKYGSPREAARWVATPETSPHVSGDAVDLGPSDTRAWLSEHGANYGLCQIYGNEPWHYELRTEATGRRCPPRYADPTQDPRMQP